MGNNKVTFCKGHTTNNGRKLSEEHKEKIRASLLNVAKAGKRIGRPPGGTPWNKGMRKANGDPVVSPVMSDEGKERVSKAMSKRMRGKRVSKKTEFKKGFTPWNKGEKVPQISGENHWNFGNQMPSESIEKMRKSLTGRKLTAEHVRNALRRRTPSSLEMKFQEIIEKHDLPYKFVGDGSFMIGRKNPDFININGEKIAIEVYARFYKLRHAETINEWKQERIKVFKEYGWNILFFDETECNENNILQTIRRI